MLSQTFQPLQDKAEMHLIHEFKESFQGFASAFLKKYNNPSKLNFCTVCEVKQIDSDRFGLVRRYDSIMTS